MATWRFLDFAKRKVLSHKLMTLLLCCFLYFSSYVGVRCTGGIEFREGTIYAMYIDGGCRPEKYVYLWTSEFTPELALEFYAPLLFAESSMKQGDELASIEVQGR